MFVSGGPADALGLLFIGCALKSQRGALSYNDASHTFRKSAAAQLAFVLMVAVPETSQKFLIRHRT